MNRSRLLDGLVGDPEVEPLFSDEAEIAALLRVEGALAGAEADAGLIGGAAAARIAEACESLLPDRARLAAGLQRDGVVIPELVAQLRAAVGPEHGGAVHQGATSQDIIDTAMVLRLGVAVAILASRITSMISAIEAIAAAQGDRKLMAQTRMQRALAFTVRDKLDTWRLPLQRDLTRLREIEPRLLVVQLGGAVGTQHSFGGRGGLVTAALAERLGLSPVQSWHSQRDRIGEFGAWLSLVSGSLGKIGQDVALMAQNEMGAIKLAGGGTSSAMAHKSNPVGAEILVTLARFNAGLLGTLHQGLVHENERSGAAWTLEWMVLPQMVIATAAGLRIALALLRQVEFVDAESGKG